MHSLLIREHQHVLPELLQLLRTCAQTDVFVAVFCAINGIPKSTHKKNRYAKNLIVVELFRLFENSSL